MYSNFQCDKGILMAISISMTSSISISMAMTISMAISMVYAQPTI